jgi:predicted ester cyclase
VTIERRFLVGLRVEPTHQTGSGIHTGELMGIPPTGKRSLEMTGIVIYRIEGGKIIERWAQHDVVGLMRQMGMLP